MELRIREFQKRDMDGLYFLDQACYPPGQRSSYGALLDALLDRDCVALVGEELEGQETRLIAALIVQGDPWNARLYILSLMVRQEFRGLGIARRLLHWAGRLARGYRCDALLARLPADESQAAFLTANGFSPASPPPGENQQAPSREEGLLWRREVCGETLE